MTERGLKLALPGRFTLPPLELASGIALEPVELPELTLRATYLDTADLRLARHGATLRKRTGERLEPIWTLGVGLRANGSSPEPSELDFDDGGREPPAAALALVRALSRHAPLVVVANLRIKRRRTRLVVEGTPVADVVDDEVSVIDGRRVVTRFRELTVDALEPIVDLDRINELLRAAGAIGAEPVPNVVRALGSRATAPPDVVAPRMPAEPTMADALSAALADAYLRLVRNDAGARLGDVEAVHQLRVALRRLRSDLRTLGDAVDPSWRVETEPVLRSLGRALGAARDLDVLADGLRADIADEDDEASRALLGRVDVRRAAARRDVATALDDEAYLDLIESLVAASADPPRGPGAELAAAAALPERVLGAWHALQERADALDRSSPDADFHRVRIDAKRARYAAELAARVLSGKRADGAARAAAKITEIQECLGALQDAALAEQTMRMTGRSTTSINAFAAGRLAERARVRGLAARAQFLELWPKARRRRWWKWAE
ncbi:MAG TPA: CHAD domain-containing protein [Candidatus Limnocylindria bacterium]